MVTLGSTSERLVGEVAGRMGSLAGWACDDRAISRTWKFENHYQAMAFANAVAWISHAEDHHPEMVIGYNTVKLIYSTHSAGGVTEADLVCAAKVSRLIEL
jgi:4a-hydroxytetrahydrobiopterin dehydratase